MRFVRRWPTIPERSSLTGDIARSCVYDHEAAEIHPLKLREEAAGARWLRGLRVLGSCPVSAPALNLHRETARARPARRVAPRHTCCLSVSSLDLIPVVNGNRDMHQIDRGTALLGVLLFTASAPIASAHNLYVLIGEQSDSTDLVDVIFEHSPWPGEGTYNGPLIERGRTWVVSLEGRTVDLARLEEQRRLGKRFLQTRTEIKGPRAIIHSCQWGVYKGRLDYFHGKYLDVQNARQLDRLAVTEALPLDLVPKIAGGALEVTVIKDGQPLTGGRIWVWSPDGKETRHPVDDRGRYRIEKPLDGTYSFAAMHTDPKPTGEFEGEAYEGVMHGTTVSLRWPLGGHDD